MDALVDFILRFYGPTPYFIVLGILILCGLGLPIPEDITLFAAGLLAYYGVVELWPIIACCFAGVMLGDSIIFFLGTKFGRTLTKKWLFHRLLPDDRLDAVSLKFRTRGNSLLFAARFMPGLRAPVYFSAGVLHIPFAKFFFYDGLAALISVPAIISAVYYFGDELDQVVSVIKRVEHGILFVILGVLVLVGAKWYTSSQKSKNEKSSSSI